MNKGKKVWTNTTKKYKIPIPTNFPKVRAIKRFCYLGGFTIKGFTIRMMISNS